MKSFIFKISIFLLLLGVPVYSQTDHSQDLKEGLQFLQLENFDAAVGKFSKILQIEPDNYQARLGLAIALIGKDKFPEASREIAKLLSKSPDDKQLLEMAAQSFWQQKRSAETETVLKRRLDLGDQTAELWAFYGDALEARKKPAEAVAAYQKAVELKPDSIDLRYALGSLYWKQIRFGDAEREFLEILRRVPNEPRASFNLGDIYLSKGFAEKAVALLENSVKAFPDNFDTRLASGRAYLAVKNYDKAIENLKIAINLRPEISESYYHLGLALQRKGQREEAKTYFKKAKDLQKAKLESENLPVQNKP